MATKTFKELAVILVVFINGAYCVSDLCEKWMSTEIVNANYMQDSGVWDIDNQILYPNGTFWTVEGKNNSRIYGCPCMLKDRPCLRKCCQKDEAMDFDNMTCIKHNAALPWFQPNVSADIDGEFRQENEYYFGLIYGNFCFGYLLEPAEYENDTFYLNFSDGKMSMPKQDRSGIGPKDYCFEYFPTVDVYLPYLCFDIPKDETTLCENLTYIIYPLGMIISIIFLLVSLAVYIMLPELRNLHGKSLMCHMSSLLCSYVCLTIVQRGGQSLSDNFCTFLGFLIYFSILSTFLWLNVMCIDICIAFSSFRFQSGSENYSNKKKFIKYMLYAFGIPFIIIIITAILELSPNIPDTIIKPNFKRQCWFYTDKARRAYFVAPIGVIIMFNIVLFIITAYKIFKVDKETKMLNKPDSQRHDRSEDRNRFKLYLKLSVVMGVSWVMEIVSSIIGGSKCIWYLTDLVNILQGVFIFFIFVWKKNVRNHLKKIVFPNSPSRTNINECRSSDANSLPTASSKMSEGDLSLNSINVEDQPSQNHKR